MNVASGGTETVDITVNYMGLSVIAPDSASVDFPVKWMSRPLVTGYQLQQDNQSNFSTATNIYSGSDTTCTVPIQGKTTRADILLPGESEYCVWVRAVV